MPVCDEKGALLGMLSEGDLMRPFGAAWRRAPTDLMPEFLDYIRQDRRGARDLMTRDVVTASEGTSLSEVADLMNKHRIKRVPILSAGKSAAMWRNLQRLF